MAVIGMVPPLVSKIVTEVDDWCELDNLLFLDKAILSGG